MAHLRLIVSPHIFFFQEDPGEGRGIAPAAVEIGAHHLADSAPRAEGFIDQNYSSGQGYFLPIGKGEDLQEVANGHNATETESTEGDTFKDCSPADFLGHQKFSQIR
jgi:hypothetical protein